ncbi:MAG: PKD domain-containing protein, partial [Ferruginibacter sp.]
MKKTLLISFLLTLFISAEAKHITGGEIFYDFLSATSSSRTYRITVRLFRDQACDASANCAQLPATVKICIFDRGNNQQFGNCYIVDQSSVQTVPVVVVPACITNPPTLNYRLGIYTFTVTLPNNAMGYTAAFQTCCRIDAIENVASGNGDNVGATYTAEIPGTNTLGTSLNDNSSRFETGLSIICFNKPFTLDFSATDPDGDQLVYTTCSAYGGGSAVNADVTHPADAPPYLPLNYINGYSGVFPLGSATINSQTGIISGIAPDAGRYVVSVCVSSYRNGTLMSVHRKDFIITVAPCDLAGVKLDPNYITCDGFDYTFENLLSSPLNLTTYWDFGDPASPDNIATDNPHNHVFTDTGIYTIKLVINRGGACSDSAYALVKVYPGYHPAMSNNSPRCQGSSVQLFDNTTADYSTPNSWIWDFGDPGPNNTSTLQNPFHTYNVAGNYYPTLTVGDDKGCVATIKDTVIILDKPPFSLTNDTLICSVDNLQLVAIASANCCVTWSPNYAISDIHSFTPVVHPLVTTTYSVSYSDNLGCSITDQVTVRVVDTVSLKTGADTTICLSDAIKLSVVTDALKFEWTESPAGSTLSDVTLQHPLATPTAAYTTYYVTGNIGSCIDRDSIHVRTVPYPIPYAGVNQTLCAGMSTSLQASGGSIYSWSPPNYLSSLNTAFTNVITPGISTPYVVTVSDTLGCPKAVSDGVMVFVNHITADAGPRDTSVVLGQPLQLHGTGSTNFLWTGLPETQWLNNTTIASPVALPQDNIDYVLLTTDSIGCYDTDTITVKYYKIPPDLYVPTGFSPNADGTNDVLKPLALGLKSINAFKVFNRWGQLMYATTKI